MKSQPEKQGNQTMKFGQLIEYNTRNTFHEKSYTKCYGETISSLFSKKSKFSISLDLQWDPDLEIWYWKPLKFGLGQFF